jgi:hypothetical protein
LFDGQQDAEKPRLGSGEKQDDSYAVLSNPVAIGMGLPLNQSMQSKTPEVVSHSAL